MNRLDFGAIASHPKFFGGYSDITALHIMLNQRCGFASYHMPMPSTEVYKQPLDGYTTVSYTHLDVYKRQDEDGRHL